MTSKLPSPSPQALAADAVCIYLQSSRGRLTPLRLRARLMTLDWAAIGAGPIPSIEQVHWTRLWLEDTSLAEARLQLEELRLARAWAPPACPRRAGEHRFPSAS